MKASEIYDEPPSDVDVAALQAIISRRPGHGEIVHLSHGVEIQWFAPRWAHVLEADRWSERERDAQPARTGGADA
jgi:hypothetical protein